VLGVVGALGLSHVLAGLVYGVSTTDPLVLAAVALLLLCVALLASWLPARRASRVDPMSVLRSEG
jgi:putative ABC transport system permease protein